MSNINNDYEKIFLFNFYKFNYKVNNGLKT